MVVTPREGGLWNSKIRPPRRNRIPGISDFNSDSCAPQFYSAAAGRGYSEHCVHPRGRSAAGLAGAMGGGEAVSPERSARRVAPCRSSTSTSLARAAEPARAERRAQGWLWSRQARSSMQPARRRGVLRWSTNLSIREIQMPFPHSCPRRVPEFPSGIN
jgi:hypothetical protein